MEKVDEHEHRENQVRGKFRDYVRKRRFHAVDAFYQDVLESTRGHVENRTQRHTRKLVTKILADVAENVERRYVRKRRRNAVEQDIPEPECRNNQAFLKVNIPVAHARKQFAYDICDNDVRSDSASDA